MDSILKARVAAVQGPDVLEASFFAALVIGKHLLGVLCRSLSLAVAPLLWDLPRMAVLLQDSAVLCLPAETAQHPVAMGHVILLSS